MGARRCLVAALLLASPEFICRLSMLYWPLDPKLTISWRHGISAYYKGPCPKCPMTVCPGSGPFVPRPLGPWPNRPNAPLPPVSPFLCTWRWPTRFWHAVKWARVAKKRLSQAHLCRVVCLDSSISWSICLVTLLRSFCRSLAFLYFSWNLRAASGVSTH